MNKNKRKTALIEELVELELMVNTGINKLHSDKKNIIKKGLMKNEIRATYEAKKEEAKKDYEEYKTLKLNLLKSLRIREKEYSKVKTETKETKAPYLNIYKHFNYDNLNVSNNILNQKKARILKELNLLTVKEKAEYAKKKIKTLSPEQQRIIRLKKKYSVIKISNIDIKITIKNLLENLKALLHPKNNQVEFSKSLIKRVLKFYQQEGKEKSFIDKLHRIIIKEILKVYEFYRLPKEKYEKDFSNVKLIK